MSTVTISTRNAKNLTAAKAAWLEERRSYIGATDAGAILGVNPYRTPHDVWLDKKGLIEDESSIAMRAGTYMEAFIAAEYQRHTGVKILRSQTYRHKDHAWAGCNPDREVKINGVPGLLECKRVGFWASKNFGQDGSDQIPEHYMIQILWQLIVTGRKFVQLAALVDDRELRIFTYSLDPDLSATAHIFPKELARDVFKVCGQFWHHNIMGDNEPPMTGQDSDTEWLKGQRATYENGALTNTDEITDAYCKRLERAIARRSRAELVETALKNRIKKFMVERGASKLESTAGFFSFATDARGRASFRHPFRTEKA